jgi:hypothetical protein
MEIVVFIVGLVFAAIGGYVWWDARRFSQTAVKGEGRVIGFSVNSSRSKRSNRQTTYSPVIAYQHQGQDYQFTGRIGSSRVSHEIGDRVAILIAPHAPGNARLDGPGLQIFGGLFFAIGVGLMIFFFFVFDFSAWSLGIAAVVLLMIAVQAVMHLRKHNIRNVDDMKQALAKAKQAHQRGEIVQGREADDTVITDPAAFARERKRRKAPLWILALFFLVGVGVLIGGGFVAKKRSDFLAAAQTASGQVVDFKRRTSTSDGKTTTTYYPIVRYRPPGQAQAITFEHDTGSSSPAYHRGERVTVLYAPYDPREAIIDAGWMNWFGSGMMILLGTIFALVGGLGLRRQLKKRKAVPPPEVKLDF